MQPLGTKKLCTFLGLKKLQTSCNKKITKPLWTKKTSRNLLGQKNHATSQDKKINQPLYKTNQATSWDKKKSVKLCGQKKTQPLGTKKSRNLSGPKIHATSWNKKITQPVKTKNLAFNRSNYVKISP